MYSLRLQISVRYLFYQGALPPTRNKVGVFYSLAPPNQQTDRMHQPRVGPVPPAICKQAARWLVRPLTHGGVPAQQSRLLCYPTASVPARHQMYSSYGLRTLTELLWSRDGQRVYGKDENGNWRSEVYDPQSTKRHKEVLQPTQNSSSGVQPRWQSLPWCIRYLNHMPFTETLASMAWPLCSGTKDRTYGLSPKATTPDEATLSSVQHSEAYSGSRRPNYRTQNGGPSTTYSHRWRSRVEGRGNTW